MCTIFRKKGVKISVPALVCLLFLLRNICAKLITNSVKTFESEGETIMQACLLVAAGGAVGAVARYLLGLIPISMDFPIMTMLINFFGSVLIGFVASSPNFSKEAILFLKTGVCGGFTTFSTFSLDTVHLLQGEKAMLGVANAAVSVGVCLIGVMIGESLGRMLRTA